MILKVKVMTFKMKVKVIISRVLAPSMKHIYRNFGERGLNHSGVILLSRMTDRQKDIWTDTDESSQGYKLLSVIDMSK